MKGLYEQEHFIHNPVPIRIFRHHYVNDRMFTVNHWHRSVEIDLILCGEVLQTIGDMSFLTGPNDLCIINSGVIHSNRCETNQEEIRAITLQISVSFLEKWIGGKRYYKIPETQEGKDELRLIMSTLAESQSWPVQQRAIRQMEYIFRLMAVLQPWSEPYDAALQDAGLLHFNEVLDYIENHCAENLTLQSLAEHFGYSSSYLSSAFKKHIGDNFHRHLQIVRLNSAVIQMRENPKKTLLACAAENGFPNVKSFIRVFKEEYGCTPSQWRKSADRTQNVVSVITIE